MKLRNLIFTIPALASAMPIIAASASCSCSKYNPVLEGDCAKYVQINKKSDFKLGEKYQLEIEIKSEYVNKYFLPKTIPYIMCGNEEVYSSLITWSDTCFDYEVDKTHTWATITIHNIPGRVTLDFSMAEIEDFAIDFVDSFEDKAFFDVGSMFDTKNIVATLYLTDSSEIVVDSDHYNVESDWKGHVFTDADANLTKDVKIIYQAKDKAYTHTYTAKCVKKSIVKMNGERYDSIPKAIQAFVDSNEKGIHLARIVPGNYVFEETLAIQQQTNKTLILTNDDGDVNLSLKTANAKSNLIEVTPATDASYSCITFLNLNFNKPEVTGVTLDEHNFVCAKNANGIEVIGCKLNGIEGDDANKINAVKCDDAQNIRVGLCESNYINSYITGSVKHYSGDETRVNYDVLIDRCESINQVSIGSITGENVTTFMNQLNGGFFYAPETTLTSNISSAYKLNGTGEIVINECALIQLAPGKDDDKNAFIEVQTNSAGTASNNISIWNSYFVKNEENPVHDLYNSSTSTVWTYKQDAQPSKNIEAGATIDLE